MAGDERMSRQTSKIVTGNVTPTKNDNTLILDATSSAIIYTHPAASIGAMEFTIEIKNADNPITFAGTGGDTFPSPAIVVGKSYVFQSDGISEWMVVGGDTIFGGNQAGVAVEGNDDRINLNIRSVAANTTELAGDDIIVCDPTTGNINVNMLSILAGIPRIITIKYTGATNGNLVTIVPSGIETIDGQASYEICTLNESLQMIATTAGWEIITPTHNEGQVKINTGNGLQPTIVYSGGTVGTFQDVQYASPLVFASSPTTTRPKNVPIVDRTETNIYDFVNNTFLENKVPGQLSKLRVIMTFSGKSSGLLTGAILRLENTLSGFISEDIRSIPSEITAGSITFELSTIADAASLPAPFGTGQGYELSLYADDPITFVVTSVTRISAKK